MKLQFLQHTDLSNIIDTLISLSAAFILGALIGFERQYRQRTAGLRTNVLVAVGAAIFVDIAINLTGADGAVRVIAYVVSGIGFGCGCHYAPRRQHPRFKYRSDFMVFCSRCWGADLIIEAILATAFILSANTLLRPIVHIIDRRPLDDDTEVLHVIYIICERSQSKVVMDELNLTLKHHNYPAKDIDVTPFGEKEVEIEVTLIATSIEAEEAQHIINHLNAMRKYGKRFGIKHN